MATQRTSFTKLQRDRAKKAKAAAKRERRLERAAEARNGTDDNEVESSTEARKAPSRRPSCSTRSRSPTSATRRS